MGKSAMKQQNIHIIGAGLAGALLAILLVQKGHRVKVFEKRSDPRKTGMEGGRSINLALAFRGLYALQQAGLDDEIMPQVVMMRGRMVHDIEGNNHFLRYGIDDSEVIWSVHRGRLNLALIEAAEQQGVHIEFGAKIEQLDVSNKIFHYTQDDVTHIEHYEQLLGTDGAGSSVRYALVQQGLIEEKIESLGHNYRELEIAPSQDGKFKLDANALHIWPRGRFMCIAEHRKKFYGDLVSSS
jgi:kynurenine 3-monooxygenase